MTIYKDVLEKQNYKCADCGRKIDTQPVFSYQNSAPVSVSCVDCSMDRMMRQYEVYAEAERVRIQEQRRLEREDWLNPSNPNYETRLRCSNEGHKLVHTGQGYVGGGCWCGYYSPEEKPLISTGEW